VDARGDRHQRQAMADIFTGVDASPLVFSVRGRCAYETTFEYSSDDA